MVRRHSFTEYVGKTLYNQIFEPVSVFVQEEGGSLNLKLKKVKNPEEYELLEFDVKTVKVEDQPEMRIQFEVILEAQVKVRERDYHYDEEEVCYPWFLVRCTGDIDKKLEDLEILHVEEYVSWNKQYSPMSDALVPIMDRDKLDDVAEEFLREYYPKALLEPCYVDPDKVLEAMKLKKKIVQITKDNSVFGRCYFRDSDVELYDQKNDSMYTEHVSAGTILVDENTAFFRNLGTLTNTVIHECVHWYMHKKAFALAELYDYTMGSVGCEVKGGIQGMDSSAMKWMEWQANALSHRIQMPLGMFKRRVDALISETRAQMKEYDLIDVVEVVINKVSAEFGVTRTAAKIRMVDAGYDVAIGAFNYIDGRYLKPHKSSKIGADRSITYSIGAQDAAILGMTDANLRKELLERPYIYVDGHYVLNSPRYLEYEEDGTLQLSHYARNHMDECCIPFKLVVQDDFKKDYSNEYYLNRDEESPVSFKMEFNYGLDFAKDSSKRDKAIDEARQDEYDLLNQLKGDYMECLEIAIDWMNKRIDERNSTTNYPSHDKITQKELIERTELGESTVHRVLKEGKTSVESLFLICIAIHIPPKVSHAIIERSPVKLNMSDISHQWMDIALNHMYPKTVKSVKQFLKDRGVSI